MHILISNDDGIDSPGIQELAKTLGTLGEVTVVAPHRERSTSGHSLTLHKPLRCLEVHPNQFAVTGTPADCVFMATRHIMKKKPDLIVSGINRGANLGHDIFYSGTVAAAREGSVYGIRSMAVSLCINHKIKAKPHWDTASHMAKILTPLVMKSENLHRHVVNINVPDLPASSIKGIRMSRQGYRYYSDEITERTDPRGRPYYWLGGGYKGFEPIPKSDCVNVDEGFVAVTCLKIDTTDYELMEEFKKWELEF